MDLNKIAGDLIPDMKLHIPYLTDENILDIAALCIGEESGELLGAYRRYSGRARRNGSLDNVRMEMADVLINVGIMAECLGINLETVIEDKLKIVYSRGWKEESQN